ncbi:hypothetical protein [Streptosporangium sp. NPDC049046]|uniref:hypothetical protein n=1 Tax=Streptosporangium sp. NPDC049046 TaxID=3155031 RepID=UPI003424E7FA
MVDRSPKTAPAEFLLARVNIARNSASIPDEVKEKLAMAKNRKVWEMGCTRESRAIFIRRHDAYYDEALGVVEVQRIERREIINGNMRSSKVILKASKREVTGSVARKETRIVSIWEVEDRRDLLYSPATFVFTTANEAASLHASLLAELVGREDLLKCEDIAPHLPDLFASYYNGIANTSDPIRPQISLEEKGGDTDIDSLKAMAIAWRSDDRNPKGALKDMALDIYRSGERNIRSISRATGLARDTIYLLLYAEGLKDFPLSYVVSGIREKIFSSKTMDGAHAPSIDEVAQDWNISKKDASKVLAVLRAAGVIRIAPGGAVIDKIGTQP